MRPEEPVTILSQDLHSSAAAPLHLLSVSDFIQAHVLHHACAVTETSPRMCSRASIWKKTFFWGICQAMLGHIKHAGKASGVGLYLACGKRWGYLCSQVLTSEFIALVRKQSCSRFVGVDDMACNESSSRWHIGEGMPSAWGLSL